MRFALTLTVLTGLTAMAQQPAGEINYAPRFNVLLNERFFNQATPKSTLAAVVKAADLGQYDYIAAYLMDEPAADAAIASRGNDVMAAVERDLRKIRESERADPFKPPVANPLPLEPEAFAERVKLEATYRGFHQLVSEIRERFVEDPSHLRELQRYLRDGETTVTENTARMTIKSEKGKAIYFRKIGTKWFLEDRNDDKPAAAAPPTTKE